MRQIIALGGGGFLMEPANPLLDLYVLQQANKARPKICFLGTASGDAVSATERFHRAFKKHSCVPSDLSLFRGHTADIETFLLSQDILYVGGGNTRNLLTLWKDWGVDRAIRKAYEQGTVLAGISAGSICWFEQGVTDSVPGTLSSLNGLGWLKGSNCPHYDGEKERRPAYHRLLQAGQIAGGLATEDSVAAHYINEELTHLVSSQSGKRAYALSLKQGEVIEEELKPRYLGINRPLRQVDAEVRFASEELIASFYKTLGEVAAEQIYIEMIEPPPFEKAFGFQKQMITQNWPVYYAVEKGEVVGWADISPNSNPRLSHRGNLGMGLKASHRGIGLGAKLLKAAVDHARRIGLEKVELSVYPENERAVKLYRELGFLEEGLIKKYRKLEGRYFDCLLMSLDLTT